MRPLHASQIIRLEMERGKPGIVTLVILSTVILAGILTAGCMQESGSGSALSEVTTVPSLTTPADQPAGTPPALSLDQTANPGERPGRNLSGAGMPMNDAGPSGLQMNGTAPSGFPMNGTPPQLPGSYPPERWSE